MINLDQEKILEYITIYTDKEGKKIAGFSVIPCDIPLRKEELLKILDEFDKGELDVWGMEDEAEELREKVELEVLEYLKRLGIDVQKVALDVMIFDEYTDKEEHPYIIEWQVLGLLEFSMTPDLTPEDILYIRCFLETPPPRVKDASNEWGDYWNARELESRGPPFKPPSGK